MNTTTVKSDSNGTPSSRLEVDEPDSAQEKEAESVADQVMMMPEHPPVTASDDEEEDGKLRMSPNSSAPLQMNTGRDQLQASLTMKPSPRSTTLDSYASPKLSARIAGTRGQGSGLPPEVQQSMSKKMGADFSDVSVHSDSKAAWMNESLGSKAFTHGSDIYFNREQYNPNSRKGQHLLAHELAHVVQQKGNNQSALIQRNDNDNGGEQDNFAPFLITTNDWRIMKNDGLRIARSFSGINVRTVVVITNRVRAFNIQEDLLGNFALKGNFRLRNGVFLIGSDANLRFGRRGEDVSTMSIGFNLENLDEEFQSQVEGRDIYMSDWVDIPEGQDDIFIMPMLILVASQETTEDTGGEGCEQSGAPGWAWELYQAVKLRVEDMRAAGASSRRLPSDLILLRADEEGNTGINVWLNPENEEGQHAGPRRRVPMQENQTPDELLSIILDVTEELAQQDSTGEREGEASEEQGQQVDEIRYSAPFGEEGEGEGFEYPPLDAQIHGLSLQPTGGTGVFSMDIDYSQSAPDLLGQVSWAFQHTYYRWEVWDITNSESVQQRAEEIQSGGLSSEEDEVGRFEHISGDFGRQMQQLAERPEQIRQDRREALMEGRYMDVVANELNEDLYGLEAAMALGGELLGATADVFSDDQERSIHWTRPGIFVVRCIGVINPGAEEEEPRRAPSVSTLVVSVRDVEEISKEAIGMPAAQLEELRLQLLLLQSLPEGHPDRANIPLLQERLEEAELTVSGTPTELIEYRLDKRREELANAREQSIFLEHGLHDSRVSRLEREVEVLEDQLRLANLRREQLQSDSGNRPVHRAQGVLVSNVTGQTYPLLLQISEPVLVDDEWKCFLSDVTSRDANKYEGFAPNEGPVEDAKVRAVWEAVERFAGDAGYGEGQLTISLPSEGYFASLIDDAREKTIESRPRDWTAARQRLEELAQVIAVLGLVVTSPAVGITGGVLSAALAAERIVSRMENDTFRWDSQAIGDVIEIVTAGVSIANVGSIGALRKIPDGEGGFYLRTARSAAEATHTTAEVAEEALDVAGIIHCNAETAGQIAEINEAVANGEMTRTEARRQKASIMAGAIQSNGMSFIGRVRGASGDPESRNASREQPSGQDIETDATPSDDTKSPSRSDIDEPTNRIEEAPSSTAGQHHARRGAELERLRAAMGEFEGRVPIIERPNLGQGVQVRYKDGSLVLEVGPRATDRHVGYHVETMRQLARYEGVVGMIRQLASRIRQMLGLGPGYGSRGFEARLEVDKLRRILSDLDQLKQQIDARAERLSSDASLAKAQAEQAAIQREIDSITAQLQEHQRAVESTASGAGYVAARDEPRSNQAALDAGYPPLDEAPGHYYVQSPTGGYYIRRFAGSDAPPKQIVWENGNPVIRDREEGSVTYEPPETLRPGETRTYTGPRGTTASATRRRHDRAVVIRSEIGPGRGRLGYERAMFRGIEVGLEGWHRAHSQGQGTGHESPFGILYAPGEVNLKYQNSGIEQHIRDLFTQISPDVTLHLTTETIAHADSRRLKSITYKIGAERGGEIVRLFEAEIQVHDRLDNPNVQISGQDYAALENFLAGTPGRERGTEPAETGTHARQAIDVGNLPPQAEGAVGAIDDAIDRIENRPDLASYIEVLQDERRRLLENPSEENIENAYDTISDMESVLGTLPSE
ncbi:eCIS core domain-containing protein [Fodinibius sediminis]|uniref:Toxin 4 n=1 Tax=Fodinibius sediminis TaxID=1214077 RepID=A0A521DJB8_9BACT|nr:DUF4157 domain-containing protein [Fodinibius sediminis]SMO71685.1 toxin 4 [Fodinibius sediminis]